ncbi:MAG: RagB/SusD family nutrient uptake outer membrane protein [Bacteroidales bacterium]
MNIKYFRNILPAIVLAAGLLSFNSCTDDLNVTPIDPNLSADFKQDEVFHKIYATMALTGQKGADGNGDVSGIDEGTSGFYRLIWNLNELPTDEALCAWGDVGIADLNFAQWSSSHNQVEGMYNRLYFDITLCNHFLEKTEGLTDDNTIRQRAEVRYMRALNYYYLLDMFGNVPFALEVNMTPPSQIKRADLFAFIEQELSEIEGNMFEPKQGPYGRADKAANWLLRSRLLLNAEVYTGSPRWADAATYAKKVIDSPYRLVDNYKYLFMADNDAGSPNNAKDEIILPIAAHRTMTRSWTTSFFLIASSHSMDMDPFGMTDGWSGNRARRTLIEKFFENGVPGNANLRDLSTLGDERALFFAQDRTLDIADVSKFEQGFSVSKFSNVPVDPNYPTDSKSPDTDIPFLRAAEAYLTFAEATLRASGNAQEALEAVNKLRVRANAEPMSSVDLDKILDEKAREFFFEGQRRTDLIRYGYFGGNSSYSFDWKGGVATGTNILPMYNLYPIPMSDYIANGSLVQNPGY